MVQWEKSLDAAVWVAEEVSFLSISSGTEQVNSAVPREMKKHKLKHSLKEKRGCWVTEALSGPGEKRTKLSFILVFFVNIKGVTSIWKEM